MLLELARQLPSEDGFLADPIVELFGVQQLAARYAALEHGGLQHRAARIERSAHPRRPGADDDDVVGIRGAHDGPRSFRRATARSSRNLARVSPGGNR